MSKCEQGKSEGDCKICGIGGKFCEHQRQKSRCKECGGSAYCEHGKLRYYCVDCNGLGICKHKKQKAKCKECDGSAYCEHDRLGYYCVECRGGGTCEHKKLKAYCKQCGGSALCKTPICETIASKKYNGYCLRCCIYQFPEMEVTRNYKTKEKAVVDRITEAYPTFTWIHDKKVADGCSLRRPDLLLDLTTHVLIVEIDENKHTDYECSCENKRLMEISKDLGHRPTIFIRFNPDSYENDDGIRVTSCWTTGKNGILHIAKNKQKEWERRIALLFEQIEYWSKNPTNKTIEIVGLFY